MGLESRDKGVTVLLGPVAGALGRVSRATPVHDLKLIYYETSPLKAVVTGKGSVLNHISRESCLQTQFEAFRAQAYKLAPNTTLEMNKSTFDRYPSLETMESTSLGLVRPTSTIRRFTNSTSGRLRMQSRRESLQ